MVCLDILEENISSMNINITTTVKNVTDFEFDKEEDFEYDFKESFRTLLLMQGVDYEDIDFLIDYEQIRE